MGFSPLPFQGLKICALYDNTPIDASPRIASNEVIFLPLSLRYKREMIENRLDGWEWKWREGKHLARWEIMLETHAIWRPGGCPGLMDALCPDR